MHYGSARPEGARLNHGNRLVRSIILTVLLFLLLQAALLIVIVLVYRIPFDRVASFFFVAPVAHGMLLALLLIRKQDFVIMQTGDMLERINIPNVLSLFRISATPSVLYLLILARDFPVTSALIVLVVLSFISDFLDGRISRRLHQVTKIGTYLDSVSDYAILIAVSIAFNYFHLVDTWFFVLISVRLGFQFVGMATLILYRGRVTTGSNFIGKASIFVAMVIYALALLSLVAVLKNVMATVLPILEYIGGTVVLVSLGEKIYTLGREFIAATIEKQQKREQNSSSPGS